MSNSPRRQQNVHVHTSSTIILILLGMLVLFLLTFLGGYLFLQKNTGSLMLLTEQLPKNNTLHWISYTDSIYGFSLSYPSNLNELKQTTGLFKKELQPTDVLILRDTFTPKTASITNIELLIDTTNQNNLETIKEYLQDKTIKKTTGVVTVQPAIVSNRQALQATFEQTVPGFNNEIIHTQAREYLVINKKNYLYTIHITYNTWDRTTQEQINTFISSFHLLD